MPRHQLGIYSTFRFPRYFGSLFCCCCLLFYKQMLFGTILGNILYIYICTQLAKGIELVFKNTNITNNMCLRANNLDIHVRRWDSGHTIGRKISFISFLKKCFKYRVMMTSSTGNVFRVTGPLCGEFTGHQWIPLTKASDAELCYFLWCAWINSWEDNRDAGVWRHHRAYHDVTVMLYEHFNPGSISVK